MRRIGSVCVVVGLLTAMLAAQAPAGKDAAVRAAVEHYFKGHATGDGSHFAKVFHPDAKLFWVGADGRVMQRTAADYIKGASGKPASDEALRRRRIVSIDITGNTAMVKVVLDYPATTFTDYFSMVETNGTWLIVNKTYVSARK